MGVRMRRVSGECVGGGGGGRNLLRLGGVGEDDPGQVAFGRQNFRIRCSGAGRGEDGWLERESARGGEINWVDSGLRANGEACKRGNVGSGIREREDNGIRRGARGRRLREYRVTEWRWRELTGGREGSLEGKHEGKFSGVRTRRVNSGEGRSGRLVGAGREERWSWSRTVEVQGGGGARAAVAAVVAAAQGR